MYNIKTKDRYVSGSVESGLLYAVIGLIIIGTIVVIVRRVRKRRSPTVTVRYRKGHIDLESYDHGTFVLPDGRNCRVDLKRATSNEVLN